MPNRETTDIQHPAMLAVGQRPDVLVYRQQSGLFRQLYPPHTPVRVGVPGLSDAMMIVAVEITPAMVGKTIGAAVAAEFKRPGEDLSATQGKWRKAFQKRGGIYAVVRSAADMVALVKAVQSGRLWRR